MAPELHQAWDVGSTNGAGNTSLEGKSGQLVATPRPRSCVQTLACKADEFMVSQLAKLKPADLKDAPDLVHDLDRFASSADYLKYKEDPNELFPKPGRVKIRKRWLFAPHRVGFSEWRWSSVHPIVFRNIEREYRTHTDNERALLRLLKLRVSGSPMAILVNGFSSGHHLMERVAWPMREFHRLGIGVALFALPFHGPRGHAFPPEWPQQDTAFTIEGFRQAVWDLRIAIAALREAGASHVGVVGMSLGGYTASLLATVTPDIDFMMSYIPIASIPDVMHDNGLVPGEGDMQRVLYEGYRELLVPITPVCRKPMLPPERVGIISGEFDRLATVQHGARLSAHFGTNLVTFPGGHIVQARRAKAFRTVLEGFQDRGILPRRRRFGRP